MERPAEKVNVAVALSWDGDGAPRVTAKGRGDVARRIVEIANEHGVPLDDDPELVEVLAAMELGCEIPEALFVAVAQVIAFAYRIRGGMPDRVRARRGPAAPGR